MAVFWVLDICFCVCDPTRHVARPCAQTGRLTHFVQNLVHMTQKIPDELIQHEKDTI